MAFMCGDDLIEKKRFEKQRLASLSESLFNALENVMKEIDERRLVSRDEVICRRCKGTVASYEKARKALIKRLLDSNQRLSTASSLHTPTSIVTNERPSTVSSPHTPIVLNTSGRRAKQRLLPYPVGKMTEQSTPFKKCETTFSCSGLIVSYPR